MPLYRLHPADLSFPPADQAETEPNGLLAVGGDLRPERLLNAYLGGIFPWYDGAGPIYWWSPDPRMVLCLEDFRLSRKMRQLRRRQPFRITLDQAFADVVRHCGDRGEAGTWVTPEMAAAYCRMHELGYAHSVEVWEGFQLVGGLYGISLGRMFFGESMFSRAGNASKLALDRLVGQLRAWGFEMIDCQVSNTHLLSLGAVEIPRREFLRDMARLLRRPPPERWVFDPAAEPAP